MDRNNKYEDLIAHWKTDPKIREALINRIRDNSYKLADSSTNLFTEENITEEYYKTWLELPLSATTQRVAQHPLLNKQMKVKIDEQLWEHKQGMLKWSAGLTALTVVIYVSFFSRMPRFAKFFNHQNSYLVTRSIKKTLGVYGVFLGWVASLTSSYEKGIPDEFEKKGLLKDLEMFLPPPSS